MQLVLLYITLSKRIKTKIEFNIKDKKKAPTNGRGF